MNNTKHYRVQVDKRVQKQLQKIPAGIRNKLIHCMEKLEVDPRPNGVVKLTEQDQLYRIRQGNYRIIYQIQDAMCIVLVVEIGHRSSVYKGLKNS